MTERPVRFERRFMDWIDAGGMGRERIRFPLGDGAITSGYRFTPAGSSRRIVLALHGAGNDSLFAWIGLFKRLLAQGNEIFTFDLPGHGRDNETLYSADRAVSAVGSALDECTRAAPALAVHTVGVSLGGSILLGALPQVQRRIASAALLVAPLSITLSPRSLMRELGTRNLGAMWRERDNYGFTGLIPSFGPFKRDIYPLRLAGPVPDGPLGYVGALNDSLTCLGLEAAAAEVRIPTLLIYGARDRVVPFEQGERLARLLPESELLRVPRGTHLSTLLEPAAARRLVAWFGQHE